MGASGYFYITDSEKNEKPACGTEQQEQNDGSDSMIFVSSHMSVCAVSHIFLYLAFRFSFSIYAPETHAGHLLVWQLQIR